MINNLLDILSYENIYLIANWGVIPFWVLLIVLPNHGVTNFFAQSVIAPLLLASAYGFVAYDIFLEGNILNSFEIKSLKIPSFREYLFPTKKLLSNLSRLFQNFGKSSGSHCPSESIHNINSELDISTPEITAPV